MLDPLWRKVIAEAPGRAHSLHGPDHWARVERNGVYLARRCGADELVVRLFALFHDCMRLNESIDRDHGRRGAAYARSIARHLPPLAAGQIETLCLACELHTEGVRHDDATVAACWDADRLDIGRAGLVPDASFMNSDAAKEIARMRSFALLGEVELRRIPQLA
jgi:uncharacterized protein